MKNRKFAPNEHTAQWVNLSFFIGNQAWIAGQIRKAIQANCTEDPEQLDPQTIDSEQNKGTNNERGIKECVNLLLQETGK